MICVPRDGWRIGGRLREDPTQPSSFSLLPSPPSFPSFPLSSFSPNFHCTSLLPLSLHPFFFITHCLPHRLRFLLLHLFSLFLPRYCLLNAFSSSSLPLHNSPSSLPPPSSSPFFFLPPLNCHYFLLLFIMSRPIVLKIYRSVLTPLFLILIIFLTFYLYLPFNFLFTYSSFPFHY